MHEFGGEQSGKTAAMLQIMDALQPKQTFWGEFWVGFTETRFSWLDILLAILILTVIPAFILSLIPW